MTAPTELDEHALEAARLLPIGSERHEVIRAYLEAAPSPSPAPGVVMDDEASATISRLLNTIGDHVSEKTNLRVRIEKLEADLAKAREEYNIAVLYGDEQHIRAESFKEKAALDSLSQPHPADERVVEALRSLLTLTKFELADNVNRQPWARAIEKAESALSAQEGRKNG